MMRNLWRSMMTVGVLALAAACDGGDTDEGATAGADTTLAADTAMQGMQGMQPGGMMTQMQSHMQMMGAMSADSMVSMRDQHRQMVANMLAQMNREMRDMNMATDTAWNATVDSLRQDLTRMADMNAQEMHSLMPEHHRRVMSLMEMHRRMMGGMRM